MLEKVINWILGVFGIAALFLDVFQLINGFNADFKWNVIITIASVSLTFLILLYLFLYKKKIISTFQLLKTLCHENKLHTLREVIMTVERNQSKYEYKPKIKSAYFKYTLEDNLSVPDNYDVIYEITFELYNKILFPLFHRRKDFILMRFYAILDNLNISASVPISVFLQNSINNISIEYSTFPCSVTTKGLDHINKCTSLYEIFIQIPAFFFKKSRQKPLICKISYRLSQNILLTDNPGETEHNFIIFPNNYGGKIQSCYIEVITSKALKLNTALHFIHTNESLKIADFITSKKNSHNIYQLPTHSFTPVKNALYAIHLTKL